MHVAKMSYFTCNLCDLLSCLAEKKRVWSDICSNLLRHSLGLSPATEYYIACISMEKMGGVCASGPGEKCVFRFSALSRDNSSPFYYEYTEDTGA